MRQQESSSECGWNEAFLVPLESGSRPPSRDEVLEALGDASDALHEALKQLVHDSTVETLLAELCQHWEEAQGVWWAVVSLQVAAHERRHRHADPRRTHKHYPRREGRQKVRAFLYLQQDLRRAQRDGDLPRDLAIDHPHVANTLMPLWLALGVARHETVSPSKAEVLAEELWRTSVLALGGGPDVEEIVEDAYLKACSDEAQLERDQRPPARYNAD